MAKVIKPNEMTPQAYKDALEFQGNPIYEALTDIATDKFELTHSQRAQLRSGVEERTTPEKVAGAMVQRTTNMLEKMAADLKVDQESIPIDFVCNEMELDRFLTGYGKGVGQRLVRAQQFQVGYNQSIRDFCKRLNPSLLSMYHMIDKPVPDIKGFVWWHQQEAEHGKGVYKDNFFK